MSAYKDAVAVDASSSDQRWALAADLLVSGTEVVVLEGLVALRTTPTHLYCEVIDPMPSARRCAAEYEVLVENARRALEASRLRGLRPDLPRRWLVVEDYGTGTMELWRAP
jgi:hypothetical protein